MSKIKKSFEDDGRVIADMSDVESQPLLIPRFGRIGRENEEPKGTLHGDQGEVQLDREEKRALIKGALSAGLLVLGIIALAFATLIILISHAG